MIFRHTKQLLFVIALHWSLVAGAAGADDFTRMAEALRTSPQAERLKEAAKADIKQLGEAALKSAQAEELGEKAAAILEGSPELRAVAADFAEIFTHEKPEERAAALRDFIRKHREALFGVVNAESPGRRILDSRFVGSTADWPPELQERFVRSVDTVLTNPKVKNLIDGAENLVELYLDDEIQAKILKAAEQLNQVKLSEQKGFKKLFDPKTGIKIESAEVQEMVEKVLPRFYDNLSLRIKARIAAGVLRLPEGASELQQAAEVLHNSGPAAQKLFQRLGTNVKSEEMAALMEDIRNNIRPFPTATVKEMFERNTGLKVEDVFEEFPDSFRAASVGQMHFVKVKEDGRTIALKARRPTAVPDFHDEMKSLRIATAGLDSAHVVKSVEANLRRELNLKDEAEGVKKGLAYASTRDGISSVGLYKEFDTYEDMIFMEKVEGRNLDKFLRASDLVIRGEAVSRALGRWTQRAVLDDGFFHGDPHGGNFMMVIDGKRHRGFEITFIDYGNWGQLTVEQQRGFLKLVTAIALRSPKDVMEVVSGLGKFPSEAARLAMTADMEKVLAIAPTYPLDGWYSDIFHTLGKSILTNRVEMPDSFLGLMRGRDFLIEQIREINARLDKLDPHGKLKRFNGTHVMAKTIMKEVPRIPANQLRSMMGQEKAFTIETLMDMARIWKNSYFESIRVMCQEYFGALKPVVPYPIH